MSNTSGEGFDQHDVTVRFKNGAGQGTLLYSNRVDRDTRIILDFPATSVLASAGPNAIEFARVGPNIANIGYWIQFDYASLEADTNALDGPDDVGRGGRLLPSTAADLYFAELLRWFGVSPGNMPYVLPNVANVWTPTSPAPPLGFVMP